ncbi:hypothetical protein ABT404_16180 [Streptomyces hyaluromycini]|uniref:Uncharacterized protein n=1 Tax=Streptomyces hyaluromycini TaxID=1377993 RepID=A0ABV1WW36_9ACTN
MVPVAQAQSAAHLRDGRLRRQRLRNRGVNLSITGRVAALAA